MQSGKQFRLLHRAVAWSPYLTLILTPIGLALMAFLTRRFFAGSHHLAPHLSQAKPLYKALARAF